MPSLPFANVHPEPKSKGTTVCPKAGSVAKCFVQAQQQGHQSGWCPEFCNDCRNRVVEQMWLRGRQMEGIGRCTCTSEANLKFFWK